MKSMADKFFGGCSTPRTDYAAILNGALSMFITFAVILYTTYFNPSL